MKIKTKKRLGVIALSLMLMFTTMPAHAVTYVKNVTHGVNPIGTSGGIYRAYAKGSNAEHESAKAFLTVAIKGANETGWNWGNKVTGPAKTLKAYSTKKRPINQKPRSKVDHN